MSARGSGKLLNKLICLTIIDRGKSEWMASLMLETVKNPAVAKMCLIDR